MIQIYGTYIHHLFLFNVRQAGGYKRMVFYFKTGCVSFADYFNQLTSEIGNLQMKEYILRLF